jgi:hypothetical protein
MNIKRVISSLSSGILVLSLGVACGDDEGSGVTPSPSGSSGEPTEGDAAADAEVNVTSEDVSSSDTSQTTETPPVEAGPDLPDAAMTETTADQSSVVHPVDAGDAAPAGDAGPDGGGGAPECNVGSEVGVEDNCATLAADNWCDSESASGACSLMAFLRDQSVYEVFVACLDDALESSGACDDVDAVIAPCMAAADATACSVHVEACEAYEGCETETVEECNQIAAKYNDEAVSIFAGYLYCGYDPAAAFGE